MSGKQVSPVAAAAIVIVALVVVVAVGMAFMNRSSDAGASSGPAHAPGLPKGIPMPSAGGPIVRPGGGK